MNGDPQILFHILKVKYLKIMANNIMNFSKAVFPEKNFFRKYSQKSWVFGVLTLS